MSSVKRVILEMETELSQEEFEDWLLKTAKRISINPNTTKIQKFPDYWIGYDPGESRNNG